MVDSAVPVEVPLLQFIDGRRHPCHGGPDNACGGAAVAVILTVVDISWCGAEADGVRTA